MYVKCSVNLKLGAMYLIFNDTLNMWTKYCYGEFKSTFSVKLIQVFTLKQVKSQYQPETFWSDISLKLHIPDEPPDVKLLKNVTTNKLLCEGTIHFYVVL